MKEEKCLLQSEMFAEWILLSSRLLLLGLFFGDLALGIGWIQILKHLEIRDRSGIGGSCLGRAKIPRIFTGRLSVVRVIHLLHGNSFVTLYRKNHP